MRISDWSSDVCSSDLANICDVEGTEDRIKALATQEILAGLTLADKHLDGRDWWVGQWSIADAYLYYIECAANRINAAIKDFPNLARHIARMEERPSVQRVLQWEKEMMRSEERSVGKECGSTGRYRWSPD